MDKKGSELSMNVIIIAAIAVLVLVILAVFVFRSGDNISKATGCSAMNGKCIPDPARGLTVPYPPGNAECKNQGGTCYIAVGGATNP
jgi:hypothetical protein